MQSRDRFGRAGAETGRGGVAGADQDQVRIPAAAPKGDLQHGRSLGNRHSRKARGTFGFSDRHRQTRGQEGPALEQKTRG